MTIRVRLCRSVGVALLSATPFACVDSTNTTKPHVVVSNAVASNLSFTETRIYFSLTSDRATELVGAHVESTVGRSAELRIVTTGTSLGGHEGHLDGTSRTQGTHTAPGTLRLNANTPAAFIKGGSYVVVHDPTQVAKPGSTFTLQLAFADQSTVEFVVSVEAVSTLTP